MYRVKNIFDVYLRQLFSLCFRSIYKRDTHIGNMTNDHCLGKYNVHNIGATGKYCSPNATEKY